MEKLEKKFEFCDPRFVPYIETVFARLPEENRAKILEDDSFQILADDAFHDACVLRHRFKHPVGNLAYLNTKALREPEHQILLMIASQLAFACVDDGESADIQKKVEQVLVNWGFKGELEAVRYDQAIAKSEGYKIGYQWARNQNKDYLLQHFGIYFEDWNKEGWRTKPEEIIKLIGQKSETATVFDDLTHFGDTASRESDDISKSESFSQRQAIFAGIMTAFKEIELLEKYSRRECEVKQL